MTDNSAPTTKRRGSLDDVPQDELVYRTIKIYLIGALAWDYSETVLDMAAQMRIAETKKLSRTIRSIRRDYDSLRAQDLDEYHLRREWELAEHFETIVARNFAQLRNGLIDEMRYRHRLNRDNELLVESVQIAMAVLDALMLYAVQCDEFIRKYYPGAPHSILPDHFKLLAKLLPEFAGDCYDRDSMSRQITAKILLNEINAIEMYGNPAE